MSLLCEDKDPPFINTSAVHLKHGHWLNLTSLLYSPARANSESFFISNNVSGTSWCLSFAPGASASWLGWTRVNEALRLSINLRRIWKTQQSREIILFLLCKISISFPVLTILSGQFSGVKYIHVIVKPSPYFRTFHYPQQKFCTG